MTEEQEENGPSYTDFKPSYSNQPHSSIHFQNQNEALNYELNNSVAYLTIWHFDTSHKE